MAVQFSEEVVVRIWRNIKKLGKIPTSHFGHAAVTVRGSITDYISFWPGDGAGIGLSAFRKQQSVASKNYASDKEDEMNKLTAVQLEMGFRKANHIPYPATWDEIMQHYGKRPLDNPRPGQAPSVDTGAKTGQAETYFNNDGYELPLWSQSAQNKIHLPGLGATGRLWGLSTRRMSEWWTGFKNTQPRYQALSETNCAGVALWALQAGGSEAFLPLPSVKIYAEPTQVERYAQGLQVAVDRLDQCSQAIDADIKSALMNGTFKSDSPSTNLKDGLWDLDTWKKESHLGGLTVRSSTIREIDDAVKTYHEGDFKEKFPLRFKAMADIVVNIAKHRANKEQSKRTEALLRLGSQVNALLRHN